MFSGEVDPVLTYFTDEVRFYFNGHINAQNSRDQPTNNSRLTHEMALYGVKVGVPGTISKTKTIGPILSLDVNSERHIRNIFTPFYENLSDEERD